MFVSDIVTTTAVKVKELSTNIFNRIARNMKGKKFIRRNRNVIGACLVGWLIVILVGYFIHRSGINRAKEDIYQQGLSAAAGLASNSAPLILEKDLLALQFEIRELDKIEHLQFAVITDHKNEVLAQTGTDLKLDKFVPPRDSKPVAERDDIRVTSSRMPDNSTHMGFVKNVTFSNVEIGSVYVAISTVDFYRTITVSRSIYFSVIVLFAGICIAVVFWHDRRAIAKALKKKKRVPS